MTQEAATESIELAIVACETCDQIFLSSPRRQTCPVCGGGAGLTFFEFTGSADGVTLKGAPILTPPAPPSPASSLPAGEGAPDAEGEVYADLLSLPDPEMLRRVLEDYGAEAEDIAAAVGRLQAIHALFDQLASEGPETDDRPPGPSTEGAAGAAEAPAEPASASPA